MSEAFMCGCTANHNERTYHFCSREHELRDSENLEASIRADERHRMSMAIGSDSPEVERFASEIRADEREQIRQHARTILPEIVAAFEAAEREACAKIVDEAETESGWGEAIAAAIRARGGT